MITTFVLAALTVVLTTLVYKCCHNYEWCERLCGTLKLNMQYISYMTFV